MERRIMPRVVAESLADMMADKRARIAAFGAGSAIELPFDAAAKTGTSKGFRDNWTVGFTRQVTVGVWVGNFDGSPMRGVSGVTGAGPLFRAAMEAAMRERPRVDLDREDLVTVRVCPLSGALASHSCPHAVEEHLPHGHAPLATCGMHERVKIDPRNGLRAGKGCAVAVEKTFERFDGPYAAWARAARREVAPVEYSPLCPASNEERGRGDVRIAAPHDGARYLIEPDRPRSLQAIDVRVESSSDRVTLRIDGRAIVLTAPFVHRWALSPGEHVMVAESPGVPPSAPIHVVVE
jgi:penicillin-binding protein 1C